MHARVQDVMQSCMYIQLYLYIYICMHTRDKLDKADLYTYTCRVHVIVYKTHV